MGRHQFNLLHQMGPHLVQRLVKLKQLIVCQSKPMCRVYSLVLNQFFRGAQICWIYTPGQSYITKLDNEPSTNETVRVVWGLFNVGVCATYFYSQWLVK